MTDYLDKHLAIQSALTSDRKNQMSKSPYWESGQPYPPMVKNQTCKLKTIIEFIMFVWRKHAHN